MSVASANTLIRYEDELRRRLEKLSRTYDLTTMKIFVVVECVGEELVCSTYSPDQRDRWGSFLARREACRLDLSKHVKNRSRYQDFLQNVSREEQGKDFHSAVIRYFHGKGATDAFGQVTQINSTFSFCNHICQLFERKLDTWFQSCEAVAVKLTGHVKVSNFVRVMTGQIDALCHRDEYMFAINIKVTGMNTPRPLDLAEMCLYKALVIQNGLCDPDLLKLCLLTLHLTEEKPILRFWEYTPTDEMEQAIREADVDRLIDAGKLSQHHEFWKGNVHLLPVSSMYSGSSREG
ncbi:uncharacterized protein LOC110457565 isoform X2 [Mizuhopecten yessoensis]|uniref:Uncharacterized protein n=1 Tax=Mizuhopecten yessoensis TaxID=6573 RepID=A0A210Q8F4_MIZYE|nr:uncharacterized protein LOC110457565 isoform X2 [Mizuhopecten yessoensis]OWF44995.1 hypothetical protein KP79_PYT07805 [Mizuhopecten yessoensis]